MNSGTNWSQELKSATVEGVVDDITRLKNAGELDPRLASFGDDVSGFKPREVFAGRRFELQHNKTLARAPDSTGADFIDEADVLWDAKGPFPSEFFKWEGAGGVKNSIDDHYLSHGSLKDENVLIDLAGLKDSDKDRIISYLKHIDPDKELYEILTD